jgi:hypothetical protein
MQTETPKAAYRKDIDVQAARIATCNILIPLS